MIFHFKMQEIDHRTIKLLIGLIACTLPFLTSFFAGSPLTSISASYYEGGWSRSIFIGFLSAIAAFLVAYNGLSPLEMILSKSAAIAAVVVVLFPCKCDDYSESNPYVHNALYVSYVHNFSAASMFCILACFCFRFYQRARSKGHAEAKWRARIYAVCGIVIATLIFGLPIDHFWLNDCITNQFPRPMFRAETTGLIAFGLSWLIASRVLPCVTRKDERLKLW